MLLFLFFLVLCLSFGDAGTLPNPKLIIAGMSQSGKSTLANVLIGHDPECKTCTFAVCSADRMESCTIETKYGTGNWLGNGEEVTVVDTPGFGDSRGDLDAPHIEEMMQVLKQEVKSANAIMLLLKGDMNVFGAGLVKMIRELTMIFGVSIWDNVILGVSFWKYDQNEINQRNKTCHEPYPPERCHDESWFTKVINEQLKEKLHLKRNIPAIFVDSWSQTRYEVNDEIQQEYFKKESEKLLDFMKSKEEFEFKTIEDVLKENADLYKQVDWLNHVIESKIKDIQENISSNHKEVTDLNLKQTKEVLELKDNLANDLRKTKSKLSIAETALLKATTNISETQTKLTKAEASMPPVGSIIAWTDRLDKSIKDVKDLPAGWMFCDGSTIWDRESVFYGKKVPNVNGEKYFLRGTNPADILVTQEDMVRDMTIEDRYTADHIWGNCQENGDREIHNSNIRHALSYDDYICVHDFKTSQRNSHTGHETRPRNLGVIYIIRIK